MNNREISGMIKNVLELIHGAAIEIEKNNNPSFHAHFIQMKSMELYEISKKTNANEAVSSEVKKQEFLSEEPKKRQQTFELSLAEDEPAKPNKIEPVSTPPPVSIAKPEAPKSPPPKPEIHVHESDDPLLQITVEKKPVKEAMDEVSLNEKISKLKQPAINFADKSIETPIKDLNKSISIGKKFELINTLFNGNGDKYKEAIQHIQNSDTIETALT